MKRMKSREVRDNWRDVLDYVRAGGEVIVVHYREDKEIARIVPIKEPTMSANGTVIASLNHGRTIHPYDLLDEITDAHGLSREEAHEGIHAFLSQCVAIDGEGAVILGREPIRSELLEDNPRDLDIDYWITISDAAAETIREAFAATRSTND